MNTASAPSTAAARSPVNASRPAADVLAHQLVQAGFVDRHAPVAQRGELAGRRFPPRSPRCRIRRSRRRRRGRRSRRRSSQCACTRTLLLMRRRLKHGRAYWLASVVRLAELTSCRTGGRERSHRVSSQVRAMSSRTGRRNAITAGWPDRPAIASGASDLRLRARRAADGRLVELALQHWCSASASRCSWFPASLPPPYLGCGRPQKARPAPSRTRPGPPPHALRAVERWRSQAANASTTASPGRQIWWRRPFRERWQLPRSAAACWAARLSTPQAVGEARGSPHPAARRRRRTSDSSSGSRRHVGSSSAARKPVRSCAVRCCLLRALLAQHRFDPRRQGDRFINRRIRCRRDRPPGAPCPPCRRTAQGSLWARRDQGGSLPAVATAGHGARQRPQHVNRRISDRLRRSGGPARRARRECRATASATGSLWSSPSTSTVNSAGDVPGGRPDPAAPAPARHAPAGAASSANTRGRIAAGRRGLAGSAGRSRAVPGRTG